MPEASNSKLTAEHRQLVLQWQESKLAGKKPTCQLCQTSDWALLEDFIELRPHQIGGSVLLGGPVYPNIGLLCKHCGHIALVNALAAGITPSVSVRGEGGEGDAN